MSILTQNTRPPDPPAPVLPPLPVQCRETAVSGAHMGGSLLLGPSPLSSAFRYVEPTWRNYIAYVDMEARSGNEQARIYVRIWQSLPPVERNAHVPEQICDMAQIQPSDLIAWVTKQVFVEGSAASSMVLSFNRDRVLRRTAEFAMESADNYKHADIFLKAAGALPASGAGGGRPGMQVSFFNTPVASSGSVALAGAKSDSTPVSRSGLRGMDEEIVELSRIMQREDRDESLHTRAEAEPDPPPDDNDDDEPEGDEDDED